MNKTRFFSLGTLISALLLSNAPFAAAQAPTTAVPSAPAAPASPSQTTQTTGTPTAPASPPTSYAHGYLSQNIQLTEQDKQFYASRKDLGCSFAPGMSDKTISTSIKFVVDQNVLTKYLLSIKPRVDAPASKAHPELIKPFLHETALLSDNVARPAKVVPAEPSANLDVADSTTTLSQSLANSPLTVSLPLVLKTGASSANSPDLAGIDARLSHFVTHFDTAEVGRTVTVRRAIQLIDGTVVKPGDIFSINQTVGERTVARGFGIGKVFINGTMEDQVGGGMCQVATTLFNAALLANLKIIERHQHVRTVPYVPAGGDATVYFGEKDFKFQNDTQTPLYIYYKTYGRFAVCDLFGKGEPGVKVSVVTTPNQLGARYFKGVIRRFVTVDGKTSNDYTAYSSYKWTPALDYLR